MWEVVLDVLINLVSDALFVLLENIIKKQFPRQPKD